MHQILKQSRNKVYNVQQCKRRSCLWKIILIILNFNAPLGAYSCYKITKTRIQISRKNWTCFFSNTIHQMMILLTAIDSWPKTKGHKHQENKKLPWNSRLQTYQIWQTMIRCWFCVFLILFYCTFKLLGWIVKHIIHSLEFKLQQTWSLKSKTSNPF